MNRVSMVLQLIIKVGEKILVILSVLSLATIIVSVSAGIISRYVFNSPFTWTEELATFLFIWLSFLGAGVAAARRKHVAVDFISCRFTGRQLALFKIITCTLIIIFLVVISRGSALLQPRMSMHKSVTLLIPKNYYYLPIFISAVYMIFVYIAEFLENTMEMIKPGSSCPKPACRDTEEEEGTCIPHYTGEEV